MGHGAQRSGSDTTDVHCPTNAPAAGSILMVTGEGIVETHELDDRELVIGRSSECDIRIDHRALSRRHAVVRGGGAVVVEDLGSTNGTRVGGVVRRGERCVLPSGDAFQIGPFSFLVVDRHHSRDRSPSGSGLMRVMDPTPTGVTALIADIARSTMNVLILGETGVGKEVLAETLHELSGRTGPFVRINCAALSEQLVESELFGHEKGAFTGAAAAKVGLMEGADDGTVLLDEVGELPLAMQAKLLRAVERREVLRVGAIQPRKIDVRFLAATNRDLPDEVAAGRFRRDLMFRLDEVAVLIPPLRDRRGLIVPLALELLRAIRPEDSSRLAAGALAVLEAHAWPGNVRELRSVIARAALLARGQPIAARHLSQALRSVSATEVAAPAAPAARTAAPPPDPTTTEPDRAAVVAALEACAGNQSRAAKQLGISRTTLLKRLSRYGISRPRK